MTIAFASAVLAVFVWCVSLMVSVGELRGRLEDRVHQIGQLQEQEQSPENQQKIRALRRENAEISQKLGNKWTSINLVAVIAILSTAGAFLLYLRQQGASRKLSDASRRDFRQAIESIPDAVAITHEGAIVFSNTAFRELSALFAEGTKFARGLSAIKRKDGSLAHLETVNGEIQFEGRPALVLAIRDVTAQRALDARLRITDRMLAAGTLAAGAAHQINNPLSYVLANLSFAEESSAKMSLGTTYDEELKSALHDAKEGARRIEKIVRDLHTFSTTRDSGSDRGDLMRVVQATVSLLKLTLESRARVLVELARVPEVKLGEARLGQVLSGILVNAKDAFPAKHARNEIRVTVAPDDAAFVRVDIRDNGRGMPKEVLDRIFDPFFTTKDVGGGDGLGLFVAHNLVTSAGGTLTVESTLGEGTCFTIRLPITSTAPGEIVQPTAYLERKYVLIGEPDKNVASSMRRVLGDYEVFVAHTAVDVLKYAREQELDAIVCEVAMPDLSTAELQAKLLDANPKYLGRILFMTQGGSGTMDLVVANTFGEPPIEKPFDVRAAVARLLGRNRRS